MTRFNFLHFARRCVSRTGLSAMGSIALLILPTACERNDKIVTVPEAKDPVPVMDKTADPTAAATPSAPATSPAPAAEAAAPSSAAPFTWTAPSTWKPDPTAIEFRTAGWTVGSGTAQVEITISSPFSTSAIDLSTFIDKWRKDVDLPASNDASDVQPQQLQIGGQPGVEVDLTGPAPMGKPAHRLIVAFAGNPSVYFFKIIGPADAVAQQKSAFDEFLASVKFKTSP